MTTISDNLSVKRRALQKCIAAWYTLAGVFALYCVYLVLAGVFGYGRDEFKIFEWLGKPLELKDILLLVFSFIVSVVFLLLGLYAITRSISKDITMTGLEFITYMLVTVATTAMAVSVGKYSGVFQSLPFVVFAIGAIFTESKGAILGTWLLHATVYSSAVYCCWGLDAGNRPALMSFYASTFASYFCAIVPALFWRQINPSIAWIGKQITPLDETLQFFQLLARQEDDLQKIKVKHVSLLETKKDESADPPRGS